MKKILKVLIRIVAILSISLPISLSIKNKHFYYLGIMASLLYITSNLVYSCIYKKIFSLKGSFKNNSRIGIITIFGNIILAIVLVFLLYLGLLYNTYLYEQL